MITPEYKALMEEMHKTHPDWGTSALNHLPEITRDYVSNQCISLLDYGCGKATLAFAMRDTVGVYTPYDPGIPEYAARPKMRHDMTVCTDVMEHIEEQFVDDVLDDIFRLTVKCVYMAIACYPARAILPDGRNAHVTIQTPDWWEHKIRYHFGSLSTYKFLVRKDELIARIVVDKMSFEVNGIAGVDVISKAEWERTYNV